MADTELLTRLRKIQALTESPNVNEAALAAAKLQELLIKYNVDISDVEVENDRARERDAAYVNEVYDLKYGEMWRRNLLWAVAKTSLCDAVYTAGSSRAYIVGDPRNVAAVKQTYEYLVKTIYRLFNDGWKSMDVWDRVGSSENSWKRSFALGAADSISRRLFENYAKLKRADTKTTALVVAVDEKLKDAMKTFHPHRGKGKQANASDANAFYAGRSAGQNVGLDPQVGKGGSGHKALK